MSYYCTIPVKLSPVQHEIVSWAAEAMIPFWEYESERTVKAPIVMLRDSVDIVNDRDVLSDLKYRLTEQYLDLIVDLDDADQRGQERAAFNAWAAIQSAADKVGIFNIVGA